MQGNKGSGSAHGVSVGAESETAFRSLSTFAVEPHIDDEPE